MKARLIASMSLGLAAAAIAVMPSAANAQVAATNYNYVGAGVGAGGLRGGGSDIGLSVNSKFTVADQISVRPGVVTNFNFDDGGTAISVPVTYDFAPITPDGRLLPYVGAGVSVVTGGGTSVGPMATAGVDYLLTDNLVLNGGVNVNFTGTTRVGGVVGVGFVF
jgi:outer membrane protein W